MNFVDLVGAEKIKNNANMSSSKYKDSVNINAEMLSLCKVIMALAENHGNQGKKTQGHIPYRESKLTRILTNSLGGNSITVMLGCVSKSGECAEDTYNTLNYATCAKIIELQPELPEQDPEEQEEEEEKKDEPEEEEEEEEEDENQEKEENEPINQKDDNPKRRTLIEEETPKKRSIMEEENPKRKTLVEEETPKKRSIVDEQQNPKKKSILKEEEIQKPKRNSSFKEDMLSTKKKSILKEDENITNSKRKITSKEEMLQSKKKNSIIREETDSEEDRRRNKNSKKHKKSNLFDSFDYDTNSTDDDIVIRAFKSFDVENKGYLTCYEFKNILKILGQEVDQFNDKEITSVFRKANFDI